MKRVISYDAAVHAFRAVTEDPVDGGSARARVLASVERRVARGVALRRVSVFAALLVVVASGSAAWTAAGRWRAARAQVIGPDVASPWDLEHHGSSRRELTIPTAKVVVEPMASVATRDEESAAYARAHRAHFADNAPARALVAWNAYLASYPAGVFVPEAAYNRALCLVRLGRFIEASAALRPFTRGRFGAYRREDAARLLDWLAGQATLR